MATVADELTASATSQMVLRWCSVVDVLSRRGPSGLMLTSAAACRPVRIVLGVRVDRLSIVLHCGRLVALMRNGPGSRRAAPDRPRSWRDRAVGADGGIWSEDATAAVAGCHDTG
jgi:hypothetical protein